MKNIFSHDEKNILADHIALQMTRTNEFRKKILEIEKKLLIGISVVEAKAQSLDVSQKDFVVERKKAFESITHASHMFYAQENIAPALFNHVWFIGVNQSDLPLYTSDNPVVQFSHPPQGELFASGGINSLGAEIAFPINEKLILIMHERTHWESLNSGLENCFIPLNKKNIEFYNFLQVTQADSQIYSSTLNFSTIKEILEVSPEKLQKTDGIEMFVGGEKNF